MGARIRGVGLVIVVLAVGAYLGSALYQWTAGPGAVPAAAGRVPEFDQRVRVQVLNGGGVSNMARAATDELRDFGFDVVDLGNHPDCCRDSSVVIDRVGNLEWARAVADALGITDVRTEPDSNLYLDVSVVLGRVWEPPTLQRVEAGDTLPWWDPRRLFQGRPGAPEGEERLADPGEGGGS